jgi:adenylate cyclase
MRDSAKAKELTNLSPQSGPAADVSRLIETTRRQLKEMTVLHAVAIAGAEATSEDTLIERATEVIGETLYPDNFGILLLDESAGLLRVHSSYHGPNDVRGTVVPLGEGVTGRVAKSGRPMRIDDVSLEPAYRIGDWRTRSELCVPLKTHDHILGVVNAESARLDAFDEADEMLLATLACQLATAIEKVRLFAQTSRRAEEMTALLATARAISSLQLEEVLETIGNHAQALLQGDSSRIHLLEAGGETLRCRLVLPRQASEVFDSPLRLGMGVTGAVALSGEPEIVNVALDDPRSLPVPGTPGVPEALALAPLKAHGRVIGVMTVSRLGNDRPFAPHDLSLLVALADQAAVAIENARLFAAAQQQAQELAQALAHLEELDRQKSQFIQNVSHELRTPLAIIHGYAELLGTGEFGELEPPQREPIEIISRRTRALATLVDDFTAILTAEAQVVRQEPVALPGLIQAVAADFRVPATRANVGLVEEIDPDVGPIRGDPVQLRRIVDNLVANALKFTPRGGQVRVRLRRQNGGAVVEVEDTGIGIPADELKRIFERFYQVDGSMTRRYGGTGLGLALVKEIVEAHGGNVEVSSEINHGSAFRVWLPLANGYEQA